MSIKQKRSKCIISQDFLMGEKENERAISFKPFTKRGDADIEGVADALACLITKIGPEQFAAACYQAQIRTANRDKTTVGAVWKDRFKLPRYMQSK